MNAQPISPAPTVNLLDLFFGVALLEQGFTGAQAAALVRQVRDGRAAGAEVEPMATTAGQ